MIDARSNPYAYTLTKSILCHTVMHGKTIIKHAAKNAVYQDIMLDALITAIN